MKEALRAKTGQSLTDMNNQAISAIATLEQIKGHLLTLSATISADTDNFTTEDADDVNSVIISLASRIQALIS